MLKRNENGKLVLQSLDLQIFFGELFEECENEREVEWLTEQICETAECIGEERLNEIE